MATVAVQVVSFRTRQYLERCLASVVPDLERGGLSYEINLLDNASGERLDDLAERYEHCRSFEAERNLGFGAGHNLLAANTDAPNLLVLNPDVEFISPRTSERLLQALTGSPRAAVVGPKLIDAEGRAQRYDHARLRGIRAQIALRGGHSHWRESGTREQVAWVSGAAMMVEHAAFAGVNGFDEQLFLYKEEEDLCLRMRLEGWEIFYEPAIVVRHLGSVVASRSQELARSERYFIGKHFERDRLQPVFAALHRGLGYLRL